MKILVVCYGNVCRSPLAEYLLREKAKERRLELEVTSSGLCSPEELGFHSIHPLGKLILSTLGIDTSRHKPRLTTKAMVDESDLVLIMDRRVVMHLKQRGLYGKNCELFLAFSEHPHKTSLEDPIGGTLEDFKVCAREIGQAADRILKKLYPQE